jgi:hypothetical protein
MATEHHWTLKTLDGKKSVAVCVKCGFIARKSIEEKLCTGFIDEQM